MKNNRDYKLCISYDRVSTFDQAYNTDGTEKKDASPESQRQRCLDHLAHLERKTGIKRKLLKHISDKAYSGKNTNRPGYQEMWDLIGSNKVNEIIATDLSRLSRSTPDFLDLVAHCKSHDTDLVVIGLDFDTTTPFGNFMFTLLMSLAQFEREVTGVRVRENALVRLVKDGKINGSREILGLDRDPNRKGHFIINEEEVATVERILKLYLKLPSKRKVLVAAKELGIKGKHGRELSEHMLDIIFENIKWRYRGLWYANKANKDVDKNLPDSKKYQVVKLPHGPIIKNEQLLSDVEAKIADTLLNRKHVASDDYTYLLSHILFSEDGSRFTGQCAKERLYRYYFNEVSKARIPCEDIDKAVLTEFKKNVTDDALFNKMLEDAVLRRRRDLPRIQEQIRSTEKGLRELGDTDNQLQARLLNPKDSKSSDLMEWLDEQVQQLKKSRLRLKTELEALKLVEQELMEESSLDDLRKLSIGFLNNYDKLTGTERRNTLEKFVQKVVVRSDNTLELMFYEEPRTVIPSVTRRKKSSGYELIGVTNGA